VTHTKEPWKYDADEDHMIGSDGVGVRSGAGLRDPDECAANGARMVACVNALAGIPDPAAFVARAKAIEAAARAVMVHADAPQSPDDRIGSALSIKADVLRAALALPGATP
jgi:hypothetical protein